MARSVNKAILIGNLGKDPETKYTPSGQAVTRFSVATNERWKDKSGELQERTEWHNIVCWAKLSDIAGQYLTKGSSVYVEGRIQTRSWDGQDGKKHYMTEIVANELVLLGGRSVAAGQGASAGGARAPMAPPDEDAREGAYQAAQATEINDDDIPF
jgi:single-strand DNA-binding protein